MKHCLKLIFTLLTATAFATSSIQASDGKKIIIEVETEGFTSKTDSHN